MLHALVRGGTVIKARNQPRGWEDVGERWLCIILGFEAVLSISILHSLYTQRRLVATIPVMVRP